MGNGNLRSVHRVIIIGSGFGGLGTAVQLKRQGIHDFVILERAHDVGGVWRDNSYPGCAVDVESHLYSFSFAPDADWTRLFAPQPEIWAYLQRCARDFGLLPHIRFDTNVTAADWDEDAAVWRVTTSQGEFTGNVLIAAPGSLSEPRIPDLPGSKAFRGASFHSARWNHDVDLAGRRVAVIGTGASAIQLVPAIQPHVAKLHLFQRTAPWVIPRPDRALTPRERRILARVPFARRALRAWIYAVRETYGIAFRHPRFMPRLEQIALRHLKKRIKDPALRAKLLPDYTIGCKRILLSNDYYPALAQPNVDVVTAGIREVRAHSIIDDEGVERPVDVIIYGTGFHVTDFPFARYVRGRAGRTLGEAWTPSPRAYMGTTIHGFPNLFVLQGPNTGLGHTSVIYMIEAQIAHVLRVLRHMERHGLRAVEPRAEAQEKFVAGVDRAMRDTVWLTGCESWYLDESGRNSTLWPGPTWQFRRTLTRFRARDYAEVR